MNLQTYRALRMIDISRSLYCIVVDKQDGKGATLVLDGALKNDDGTRRPYTNANPKVAEDTRAIVQKQNPRWKTEVRTLEDAFNHILKQNPGFEKQLANKLS
jgi:hypothetical protein